MSLGLGILRACYVHGVLRAFAEDPISEDEVIPSCGDNGGGDFADSPSPAGLVDEPHDTYRGDGIESQKGEVLCESTAVS